MKKILIYITIMMLTLSVGLAFTNAAYTKATLLNQDPDPAEPGEYLELRWKIEKLGNDELENISYTLDLEYPFYFDKSDTATKEIGDWKGYSDGEEFYTLYYKIRVDDDAIEDTYTMELIADYGGKTAKQVREFDIRVGEQEEPDFILGGIQSEPVKLVSGTDEAKVNVEIVNIGDGTAEDIKALLNLPKGVEPSYSYSNRDVFGKVAGGQSINAEYYIDLNDTLEAGSYNATINLGYTKADDDDNQYHTQQLSFPLEVKSKPQFEIVSSKPTESVQGESVELEVVVKNTGSKEAESVSIKAFKESSQPFEYEEKSDYIGKLNPGDEGTAVLNFDID